MLTLNDLLSTYDACTQQRMSDVTEQLARLRQEIETQCLSIKQAESELLQAQQHCLDQMRSHFAADARALLKTPQFSAFIEFLVEAVAGDRIGSDPLLVPPSPTFWLLQSREIALHLRDIESIQLDNLDGTPGAAVIRMQVAIQDWQQPVHIFPQGLRQQSQVAAVLNQIQSQFPQPDPQGDGMAYLNRVVIQELACVVLYVARLFSLNWVIAINEGFEL
ncbi:hypothetical protein [Leptolyngbya sp. NIES-2104]|uniref:hypothetical protein n=1 Tax=Leptolyngbya sp. NIES-2104 TaxID=1552121 RepID=UPI0006EC59CD|nr:hypothetical protein [Leptolyngbya sp. NIES-2104]GAP97968.1 hypothetical protein NIES2104_45210 [Leptolyngbya sp. NIES-2104]